MYYRVVLLKVDTVLLQGDMLQVDMVLLQVVAEVVAMDHLMVAIKPVIDPLLQPAQ